MLDTTLDVEGRAARFRLLHSETSGDNLVRNNIFAFGEKAQIRRTRNEPHRSFHFEHNIVYWTRAGCLMSME